MSEMKAKVAKTAALETSGWVKGRRDESPAFPPPLYENQDRMFGRDWKPQSALIRIAFSCWMIGLWEHRYGRLVETHDVVASASVTFDENSQPTRASCVHLSGDAGYSHRVAIDKSLK